MSNLTYADYAREMGSDGKIGAIIELLSKSNPILEDAVTLEGNGATSHRTVVRSGLPEATWRKLNYGVQPSKATSVQVDDTIGMLEAYSKIDKSLADLNGNTAQFRLNQDKAFLQALNNQVAETIFYGNTEVNPERFMGLSPRYSSLEAENARNVIDGGGRSKGKNTSIWFVTWDSSTCHLLFPKGQQTGIQHNDLGEVTLFDDQKGEYQGYKTHYKWDVGLSLPDWRYTARICNIDTTKLGTKDGADLINLMIKAYNSLEDLNSGKTVIYCNRLIKTALDVAVSNKNNVMLTAVDYAGKPVTMFQGVPVKICDALVNDEDVVA